MIDISSNNYQFTCIDYIFYELINKHYLGLLPSHGQFVQFENLNEKEELIKRAAKDFSYDDPFKGIFNFGFY